MPVPKLSEEEISTALRELPGWTIEDGKLHKRFQFANFSEAIGFMTIASVEIEKRNHHPEWSNVYNRVTVDLTTHDSDGITAKDADLAKLLERIAAKLA
jgi:4a-hydroxytetrahydrobiopterin dehydratase